MPCGCTRIVWRRGSGEISAQRLLTDGTITFFEGWAPAASMPKVQALLEKEGCAWEAADPTPEEYPEVPVQLKITADPPR